MTDEKKTFLKTDVNQAGPSSRPFLDVWYKTEDPWGYRTTRDDIERRYRIIGACQGLGESGRFPRALDIGAGEGFITEGLPADIIHGVELSDVAAARFPDNVIHVSEPKGKYDLVLATGVLYGHYAWAQMVDWINAAAARYIVTSHIDAWEHAPAIAQIKATEIRTETFPYREWHQRLRIFRK